MPLRPNHILFDLDGTLTDSRLGIVRSLRHTLETLGLTPPPDGELERYIGPPLQRVFPKLLGSDDAALTARALAVYRERYVPIGMFENAVYPGVADGLAQLRELGLRLWVATSKPHVYADRILEHFDLRSCFDGVFGPELCGTRADKTELVAHLLASTHINCERAWLVGDRLHDVVAARNNGLVAVGAAWGYGSVEELREAGADVVVKSMRELVGRCAEAESS
jgi:phosphoglycolate phosphatase